MTRWMLFPRRRARRSDGWTVHRKAAVVQAVRGGYLSMYEMGKTHNISVDEFLAW